MKKLILIITSFFLVACAHISESPQNEMDDMMEMMKGMPCHQMGGQWMGDCEFDEEGNPINVGDTMMMDEDMNMMNMSEGEIFSQDTAGLPEAKEPEVVELNNGDTFEMTADIVKQTVGNRVIKRLAYNGQIPGPLLKVSKDAKITVEFTNNIDVDTTIHSHGLRLENAFDGVPDVTQDPIAPGESFTYELKFPDEGVYWYHPHIREDYTQELGLYGNFLVEGADDYWNQVDREEVLILDDIALGEEDIIPFSKEHTNQALMGRFGNILLVNNEEDFKMEAKMNEVIRFYITNVSNTRTFRLSLPGIMRLVGGDSGRIEHEQLVEDIIIAPAERQVVELFFATSGELPIEHRTPQKTYKLGTISVDSMGIQEGVFTPPFLRDNSADYALIREQFDALLSREPDKKLRLSIEMEGMMGNMDHNMMEQDSPMMHDEVMSDGIEWEDDMAMMNAMSTSENTKWKLIDEETGKENMDIDWKFEQGDLVKIRIFNDPKSVHPMQHPIHFHGQRFVVLSRDGEPNTNLQWKDTALIKTGETMDFLVEMSNPGIWMAHCHIAEHLHAGMMFGFEVI